MCIRDRIGTSSAQKNASVTAGFKWAPDIGVRIVIKTNRIQPVASVFPISVIALMLFDKLSAIIPEPTTVITRMSVPNPSAQQLLIIMPNTQSAY